VGGIIPPEDKAILLAEGISAVYTPRDFELNSIMHDLVKIVDHSHDLET
jgi:(2R)-ethylmalonyl-CoA mutase